jgi:Ca2+-binding EF-hand superfamily protein
MSEYIHRTDGFDNEKETHGPERKKIKEAFDLFDREKTKVVVKE